MSDTPLRIEGGVAAVLAGVLLPLGHALNLVGGDPTAGTPLGRGAVLLAHALLVFAFVGIYAVQADRAPDVAGRLGMVAGTLGTVFVTAVVYVELAGSAGVDVTPVFATAATGPVSAAGPLLFVLGLVLVGWTVVRGPPLPRWSGGLLVVGTLVFAAASAVPAVAPGLTVIGAVLTGAGFVWAGTALLGVGGV
ncbi:hypothetical protein [Halarchaeum sp. P4]|uniref:hypothetical protein n=1 Tax=Halarchaeum sp. P4 TaxID=3421639 RepID=UPI003EB764B0